MKYLQQPIHLYTSNEANILNVSRQREVVIDIHNRLVFTSSIPNWLKWNWYITSDMSTNKPRQQYFDLPNSTKITLFLGNDSFDWKSNCNSSTTYWLNIEASLNRDMSWGKKDHVLIQQQFRLQFPVIENEKEEIATKLSKEREITNNKTFLVQDLPLTVDLWIVNQELSDENSKIKTVVIDKTTGKLCSYWTPQGHPLIIVDNGGLGSNYTRASTDNDLGGGKISYDSNWNQVGLQPLNPPQSICKSTEIHYKDNSNTKIQVEVNCDIIANTATNKTSLLFQQRIVYHCDAITGSVEVEVKIIPNHQKLHHLSSLPRIGMNMTIDESLYHVQYLGRGPFENYPDRKTATKFGIFKGTVADLNDCNTYIFPSEYGNRCDCSWISFRTTANQQEGEGMCIVAANSDQLLNFSALFQSQKELHGAKHTTDLSFHRRQNGTSPIYVNLDYKLMGLGGDLS